MIRFSDYEYEVLNNVIIYLKKINAPKHIVNAIIDFQESGNINALYAYAAYDLTTNSSKDFSGFRNLLYRKSHA